MYPRMIFAILLFCVSASSARAETLTSAARPELEVGESWTFQSVDQKTHEVAQQIITITGKNSSDYSIDVQSHGYMGPVPQALSFDLGRKHAVGGEETNSNWLSFPMTVGGRPWKAHELWELPNGEKGWDDITYRVVRIENVTVSAGTFDAFVVEGKGWWTNTTEHNSGQIELTIWYAPLVKEIIRMERSNLSRYGSRTYMSELTAYRTVASIGKVSINKGK